MFYIAYIEPDIHLDGKCNDTVQNMSNSILIIIKVIALMVWKNRCVS